MNAAITATLVLLVVSLCISLGIFLTKMEEVNGTKRVAIAVAIFLWLFIFTFGMWFGS